MAELLEDKRFAHIGRDPRFRELKKQHHKVKIDRRFKGMFNDKRFKVKYMVDKRGRPVQTSSSDHLRRYYHISSSDEEGTSGSEEEEEEEEEVGRGKEGKSSDKKEERQARSWKGETERCRSKKEGERHGWKKEIKDKNRKCQRKSGR
ncbi:hypothetical protein NP493_4727g00000 [Ridgeia piscesae]|uniref:Uncharacterized protein n=1 Tax=Ridgeia piscesae TaxID=27915 RepID=A0AAD9IYY3_RIDPI|nr:hypothetical protein NP493_4727g00000 [Ridgeia piscesae]